MCNRIPSKSQLTFKRHSHGVMVKRGFNEVFLTWKSIRELNALREVPRAERWLLNMLIDGPCEAAPLERYARQRMGFGHEVLYRARKSLGVVTRRKHWQLPGVFQ